MVTGAESGDAIEGKYRETCVRCEYSNTHVSSEDKVNEIVELRVESE